MHHRIIVLPLETVTEQPNKVILQFVAGESDGALAFDTLYHFVHGIGVDWTSSRLCLMKV